MKYIGHNNINRIYVGSRDNENVTMIHKFNGDFPRLVHCFCLKDEKKRKLSQVRIGDFCKITEIIRRKNPDLPLNLKNVG